MALLAKLGWKVLNVPKSIWIKLFLAKYIAKVKFLEAKKTTKASTM